MTAKRLSLAVLLGTICLANVPASMATTKSFSVSLTLLTPIQMTLQSPLVFPPIPAGTDTTVTTAPEDNGAVHFTATGEPDAAVTGTIIENQVTMITGDGLGTEKQIVVDSFVTGGDMNNNGAAVFDAEGNLSDLRIGASAHVEADDIPGDYSTTATLRVTYN